MVAPVDAAQKHRPDSSAFKQQKLKVWRPILTPKKVVMLFSGLGLIFLPIGIAIIVASNQVAVAETADYGRDASSNSTPRGGSGCCIANCNGNSWDRIELNPCYITLTIEETMTPPIFMYYQLANFYQNHRRYVRSRSDTQLVGDTTHLAADLKEDCMYHYSASWDGGAPINPCGLISWSWFNDTFALMRPDGTPVTLEQDAIAWQSDLDTNFRNSVDGSSGRNFPMLAYWRNISCEADPTPGTGLAPRTPAQRAACVSANAATPGVGCFRKLYARINEPLPAGTYTVRVSNGVPTNTGNVTDINVLGPHYNWGYPLDNPTPKVQRFLYPVGSFSGHKTVVLTTISWIGGRNFFLGYAYLVVGIVCIVLAMTFFIKWRLSPRDLGTAAYVTYNMDAPPK
ncbi:cell cycle control protein 50b [Chrysochromulina tobinii]|uniref:Cell cycle control protein 50b n=1 Tax=Chrysochromulina tobinii TaxID=1460289 RepID=A0A0M0JAC2_9EUKA|nr:cell cycle control protein 50b [Chrysochromulina tobinii]|eukprot:KOO23178.1 cell cycle control protein 50b [Chrysochromulina sp. CCMP291]